MLSALIYVLITYILTQDSMNHSTSSILIACVVVFTLVVSFTGYGLGQYGLPESVPDATGMQNNTYDASISYVPPLKQYRAGIPAEDVTCKTDMIWMQKPNLEPACVYPKSVQALSVRGWTAGMDLTSVQETDTFAYEPNDTYVVSTMNIHSLFDVAVNVTLDRLPRIGETATLIITQTNNETYLIDPFNYTRFAIPDGFEFVGLDTTQFTTTPVGDGVRHIYDIPTVVQPGQTMTQNVTIKAVSTGFQSLSVYGAHGVPGDVFVYLGENETLPSQEWYAKYGYPPKPQRAEVTECPTNHALVDGYCLKLPEVSCSDTPEGCASKEVTPAERAQFFIDACTEDEYASGDMCTVQEAKRWLQDMFDVPDDELDDFFPPELSTQSFFLYQLAHAADRFVSLHGKITTPHSYSHDSNNVYGVEVCVFDHNEGSLDKNLGCSQTVNSGIFLVRGIRNVDSSGDNSQIDPYLVIKSVGEYSRVGDRDQMPYMLTAHHFKNNIQSDMDMSYHIDPLESDDHQIMQGALWIVDAIHKAGKSLEDGKIRTAPVGVMWEYNVTSENLEIENFTLKTSAYNRELVIIDGYDDVFLSDEHSRWIIQHEYAHFVMDDVFGYIPFDPSTRDVCYPHSLQELSAAECAWVEGWATYLPHTASDTPKMGFYKTKSLSNPQTQFIDIDAAEIIYSPTNRTIHLEDPRVINARQGHIGESYIAAALWDIYDGPTDATADNDQKRINTVFKLKPDTFEEFSDGWISKNYPSIKDILSAHGMPFPNSAPVADSISIRTTPGSTVEITLTASDAENNPLDFIRTSPVRYGTLDPSGTTIRENVTDGMATVMYTSDDDYVGMDRFMYRVFDGKTSSKTVSVNIRPYA